MLDTLSSAVLGGAPTEPVLMSARVFGFWGLYTVFVHPDALVFAVPGSESDWFFFKC
jgi:hypothetical protein